jgi:hypothetical protein
VTLPAISGHRITQGGSVAKPKLAKALLVAFLVTSISAMACGQDEKLGPADRSWVNSNVMLYGFRGNGQFFKTKFGSNKIEVIITHHFDEAPEVIVSPDKHYVVYWGHTSDWQDLSYIYNLKLNSERTLPRPDSYDAWPAFSPNSNMLLLYVDNAKVMKLFLFDIASSQLKEIPFPLSATGDPHSYFTGFWSMDGKSIYVAAAVGKKMDLNYYRYDIASAKYTRISGHQVNDGRIVVFIENGLAIKTYGLDGPCVVQSKCGYWGLKSPNRKLVASVHYATDHGLWVTGKGVKPILVSKGGYDFCEGEWVSLQGWVNNRYLVYSLHQVPYIYDLSNGKKSILFEPRSVEDYFW